MDSPPLLFNDKDDFNRIAALNRVARHLLQSKMQSCHALFDALAKAGYPIPYGENNFDTMVLNHGGLRLATLLTNAGIKWIELPTEQIHAKAARIIGQPREYLQHTLNPEQQTKWAAEELELRTTVQRCESSILRELSEEIRRGITYIVGNAALYLEYTHQEPRIDAIICDVLRALVQGNHMSFYKIMRMTR